MCSPLNDARLSRRAQGRLRNAQTPAFAVEDNFRFRGFAVSAEPSRCAPWRFGQKTPLARAPMADVLSKNEIVLDHFCTVWRRSGPVCVGSVQFWFSGRSRAGHVKSRASLAAAIEEESDPLRRDAKRGGWGEASPLLAKERKGSGERGCPTRTRNVRTERPHSPRLR